MNRASAPMLPVWARVVAVALAGSTLGLVVWALAWQSQGWPASGTGDPVTLDLLWPYWATSAVAWSALTGVWAVLLLSGGTAGTAMHGAPAGASFRHDAILVLLVALLARLLVTATTSPVLSDDIWRYILDGQTLASGDNPYRLSPVDRAADAAVDIHRAAAHAQTLDLVERVNHPDLVTIYQPVSQWCFAGLYQARMWAANPFRLGFSLVDMAVIGLLVVGLRWAGASPWWAVLYAWHPLAISETAGSGHQDVLGILALLAALLLADRFLTAQAGRRGAENAGATNIAAAAAVGALLAAAVGVKPVVVPLAVVLGWRIAVAGRTRREGMIRAAAAGLAGAVVLTGLYLPFVLMDGGIDGMIITARTFVSDWSFNGSVHPLLSGVLDSDTAVDVLCGGLLLAVLLITLAMRLDGIEIAITYLFASLLLSSTAHPWYLLWVLALVPLRPRFALVPAVWVWSLTIGWSYAAHLVAGYRMPVWLAGAEYLPVYAAAAAGIWAASQRSDHRTYA